MPRFGAQHNDITVTVQAQVRHYRPLVDPIIAQTERRVLAGEPVPAGEKLVSLFEPHADIIVATSITVTSSI